MIIPSSIAFLYQLIPKLGTDGGVKLKEPLIEICGNFKCGNDHENLKKLLILFMALLTIFFAESMILENLFLIFPSIFVVIECAPLRPFENEFFISAILFETDCFASDIFDLNFSATDESFPPVKLSMNVYPAE